MLSESKLVYVNLNSYTLDHPWKHRSLYFLYKLNLRISKRNKRLHTLLKMLSCDEKNRGGLEDSVEGRSDGFVRVPKLKKAAQVSGAHRQPCRRGSKTMGAGARRCGPRRSMVRRHCGSGRPWALGGGSSRGRCRGRRSTMTSQVDYGPWCLVEAEWMEGGGGD